MDWIDKVLRDREQGGLLRTPRTVEQLDGVYCLVDGRRCIEFCSNDYLGLRDHAPLRSDELPSRAASVGSGASRLIAGNGTEHTRLERSLAAWLGAESALLFSSGYAMNVGCLSGLLGPEDLVLSDALNHASLIDGIRLSRAALRVVPHLDTDFVERALRETSGQHRRRWIVLESLFSMDGDFAPIEVYSRLAREHAALLYIDEAHAIGALGPLGRGLASELDPSLGIRVGTMGKALGTMGAFALGSEQLRAYLWNLARSFVFSTGVSPWIAERSAEAVAIVSRETPLRAKLQNNIAKLRAGLEGIGLRATSHPNAPIVPIVLGDEARTLRVSQALYERGLFVQAIRPPTVPPKTSRLRITVSARHSAGDLEQLVEALAKLL